MSFREQRVKRGAWSCKQKELREQDCKGIESHGGLAEGLG